MAEQVIKKEKKSKRSRQPLHPLAQKQFERVICRPASIRQRMTGVLGLVFKPGDRTNTFLGKRFLPLGSSILMAQFSLTVDRHGQKRESVPTLGIKCQIDPDTGVASWDHIVLEHDLGLRAFPGAHGKILDPRDETAKDPHQRGKGAWLEQALAVDTARRGASGRNFKLPVVPVLPKLYYAVTSPERLPFEDTPALRRRVERHMSAGGKHMSLDKMDDLSRDMLLKAEWPSVFIEPGTDGNTTGFHLVGHEFSTRVRNTTRIYECFDDSLIGVEVWNPMSEEAHAAAIRGCCHTNPAREAYAALGIDLGGSVTGDQVTSLLVEMRKRLPGSGYTDELLSDALSLPDEGVPNVAGQHALFRSFLKPSIAECCTTANVQWAIDHGNQPLFAEGLCKIQILRTDPRQPRSDALSFDSVALGRERVTATLYKA